jgi:CubicO group peptidase (beta-lactamase class C family)
MKSTPLTPIKWLSLLSVLLIVSCSTGDDPTDPDSVDPPPIEDPTGNTDPEQNDLLVVDNAVSEFMAKYDIPGAALAVSINEKMVYSKGYGLATKEGSVPTQPTNVFRVASLSKPITSTAIMRLVDEGLLNLDDKVFGPDGILGDNFGTAQFSQRALSITIDHLLLHGLGGWGSVTGDPIDHQPQLDRDGFIEYIINNWNLPNDPGTTFSYSNTGYWLLARVVEEVTGQTYENYVRTLLSEAGITTFKTTTFRENDRASNEVSYYGTAQDEPFIYTIASRRDGDGGVVISAPDMLRFLCAIDGKNGRSDLISSSSQQLMATPSSISTLGRGLGTWEAQNLLFFTGSLPGTRTWFYMDNNGRIAVLLLNMRRTDTPDFDNDLNALVYSLVKSNSIEYQTDLDQF